MSKWLRFVFLYGSIINICWLSTSHFWGSPEQKIRRMLTEFISSECAINSVNQGTWVFALLVFETFINKIVLAETFCVRIVSYWTFIERSLYYEDIILLWSYFFTLKNILASGGTVHCVCMYIHSCQVRVFKMRKTFWLNITFSIITVIDLNPSILQRIITRFYIRTSFIRTIRLRFGQNLRTLQE